MYKSIFEEIFSKNVFKNRENHKATAGKRKKNFKLKNTNNENTTTLKQII